MDSKPDTPGCVKLFQNYPIVTIGQRWWPLNAEAEQAAIAEQAAAAAEPELTPEPAAESPPAVAGLPKASDHQLWGLQRAARERARPGTGGPAWDDSYLIHQRDHIAAHRILYDHGYRSGHDDAMLTPIFNQRRDLTLLQEGNIRLQNRLKAKRLQLDDACKRIAELEQENAKLKSEVKDLAHSLSQPYAVVIGDLETELKRRDAKPTPAPEPASPESFSCGACRWYSDSNSETGLCCRHAPTHDGFPRVAVEGWCGDFTGNGAGTTVIPQGPIQ
jgi:hypothetical protein